MKGNTVLSVLLLVAMLIVAGCTNSTAATPASPKPSPVQEIIRLALSSTEMIVKDDCVGLAVMEDGSWIPLCKIPRWKLIKGQECLTIRTPFPVIHFFAKNPWGMAHFPITDRVQTCGGESGNVTEVEFAGILED